MKTKLRDLILQKHGTITALAGRVGYTPRRISAIANGAIPPRKLAVLLSEALDHEVSAAEIMGLE